MVSGKKPFEAREARAKFDKVFLACSTRLAPYE